MLLRAGASSGRSMTDGALPSCGRVAEKKGIPGRIRGEAERMRGTTADQIAMQDPEASSTCKVSAVGARRI